VTITFVGRLTSIKRPDRLVEAFRHVVDQHHEVVLLVAGEGELLDSLRIDVNDLGDRVRLLGWRSDLDVVLAASDIAILTSDNEGMPVTLIEASMAGVPCVTTDVGSAREVVDHEVTGFVTSTNPLEIASALEELVGDRRRREAMGREAAARAVRLFGEERLANDYATIYRRLVNRTPLH